MLSDHLYDLLAVTGMILNITSTKPLIYAELMFPEDCVHTFLVWITFILFVAGTTCSLIGGWNAQSGYTSGGLILEIIGTLLATPELLISLRAWQEFDIVCRINVLKVESVGAGEMHPSILSRK